jgi:hypothetical protein
MSQNPPEPTKHVFDLCTLDGKRDPFDCFLGKLNTWIEEQGIAAEVEEKDKFQIFAWRNRRFARVTIADPDHAFWFKMRWGTDVALHKKALAEEDRAFDKFAKVKFLSTPRPDTFSDLFSKPVTPYSPSIEPLFDANCRTFSILKQRQQIGRSVRTACGKTMILSDKVRYQIEELVLETEKEAGVDEP